MVVIIGMDPHKRSATIEVIDEGGQIRAVGRYGTDKASYAGMLRAGRRFEDRVWAVEGCNGIGKHIAHRLVHDGEVVVDVPPKLSAQVRVFATGNGRKTDPVWMRIRSRWSRCGLRAWSASRSTTTWWCWGCWLTDATSLAGRGHRRSTGCTGCCWSFSLVGPSSSCPRTRRGR